MILAEAAELGGFEASLNRGGCVVTRAEAANAWVPRRLPILMYP